MITVIICTYNRYESLKDTLESFLKLNHSNQFDFEILLIDNNSKDQTKAIVESYIPCFKGRLRYLFEGNQGKCYALNLGIKEAKGEILAFTDDDVLVDINYLNEINDVFNKYSEIDFIGGKILPLWSSDKPDWIKGSLLGALAMLDYGDQPFIINSSASKSELRNKIFFGANFAFRKEMFIKYGGFDVKKVVAEDTEMCLRLYAKGIKGLYAPNVVVHHKVPVTRTTPQYFYQWYYTQGTYQDFLEISKPKFFQPFGIPLWFFMQTIKFFFISVFNTNPHKRIVFYCWTLFNCSQIKKIISQESKKS